MVGGELSGDASAVCGCTGAKPADVSRNSKEEKAIPLESHSALRAVVPLPPEDTAEREQEKRTGKPGLVMCQSRTRQ